ncbi:MAG: hypothetical protein J5709_05600 [Bacteroidales bacterium]|nr:hypothetical protein [Bacteroidales bacterium]
MNSKSLIIILLACTILVAMPSCKKLADELKGTWNVMTFDTKPEGTMQITFDGNSTAVRILDTETGMKIDSCTYEVIQTPFKKRLIFRDSDMLPGYDHLNGIYRIDKMKGNVIVTTRTSYEDGEDGGCYYRLEMIRKH